MSTCSLLYELTTNEIEHIATLNNEKSKQLKKFKRGLSYEVPLYCAIYDHRPLGESKGRFKD